MGLNEIEAWYPERDLNPHTLTARDFKSLVSTDSTIRACAQLKALRVSFFVKQAGRCEFILLFLRLLRARPRRYARPGGPAAVQGERSVPLLAIVLCAASIYAGN